MTSDKQKLTLDRPVIYEIRLQGEFGQGLADWYSDLTIVVENGANGQPITNLTGTFDQAALHGLLRRVYSLGLPIIYVIYVEAG